MILELSHIIFIEINILLSFVCTFKYLFFNMRQIFLENI